MKKLLICISFLIFSGQSIAQVLDDIVSRTTLQEKLPLSYAPVREADVLWEKRIWRIIDVREKQNLIFQYPQAPLFEVLKGGALAENIELYDAEKDDFSIPLENEDLRSLLFSIDTVLIYDPITHKDSLVVTRSDVNYEDVKRFRLKELWYFDARTSTMKVRILGIAPLLEVFDEYGDFLYEKPLFWAYYPHIREELAKVQFFNSGNETSRMSWEDVFEMRYFKGYIYKEGNIYDRRLQDYLGGIALQQESMKLEQELFNFEHDLWSW